MGSAGGGKGKKTYTVGYAYFLGLAYAFCSKIDEFISFKMDGDIQASPHLTSNGSFSAKTGKNSDVSGSGYSNSTIRVYFGNQTAPDGYLSAKTGSNIAYKNTAYMIMERGFIGDNVRSAPNYSAVVRRTNIIDGWPNADIGGDANPAHIIYYMLVSKLGVDASMVDAANFQAVGNTLYNEGFGLSFVFSSAQEAGEWIKEVLRHIDGILYFDMTAQKFKLKLLRGDYVLANCPLIDETNSTNIVFDRKSWEDTVSRITVKYTERSTFAEATVSGVNTATRIILGYERAESVEFMGVSSARNANIVLDRLFRKLSYPLAALKGQISALSFPNIQVGDVVRFSNAELGVSNIAIRITSISGGKENEQTIDIEGTEDIFSLGQMVITAEQSNIYQPIDYNIGALEYFTVRAAKPEMANVRSVIPIAVFPSGFVQDVKVSDGISGQTAEIQRWGLGVLKAVYPVTAGIDDSVGFYITPIADIWEANGTRAGWQRLKFVAYIGEEQVCYQFRNLQPDGSFYVSQIMRGLNDTPISAHPIGEKVWFASVDANDIQNLPIISPTPTLSFTPENFKQQGITKTLSYTYDFSVETPYPPANLKAVRDGSNITISWHPRVRLAGANYRNADNIVAGEDEGKSEGSWLVEWEGGSETVSVPFFIRSDTQSKVYSISTVLGGYQSSKQQITI